MTEPAPDTSPREGYEHRTTGAFAAKAAIESVEDYGDHVRTQIKDFLRDHGDTTGGHVTVDIETVNEGDPDAVTGHQADITLEVDPDAPDGLEDDLASQITQSLTGEESIDRHEASVVVPDALYEELRTAREDGPNLMSVLSDIKWTLNDASDEKPVGVSFHRQSSVVFEVADE